MAVQDWQSGFDGILLQASNTWLVQNGVLLDADGEKFALIFQVPKSGNIARVGFITGATFTTGGELGAYLQTVNAANGDPSGTLYHANADCRVSPAAANTQYFADWENDGGGVVPVTKGDLVAFVLDNNPDAVGTMNGYIGKFTDHWTQGAFPYARLYTTSWADQSDSFPIVLEYDDDTSASIPGTLPVKASADVSNFGASTTPKNVGLRFQYPLKTRISGFCVYGDFDDDVELILYGSDGTTASRTVSRDKDVRRSNVSALHFFELATDFTCEADTAYRAALKPTGNTVDLHAFEVASQFHLDAVPGGRQFYLTSSDIAAPTGTGDWTDTTTKRPFIWPIVSGIDDGADGAGSAGSGGQKPRPPFRN